MNHVFAALAVAAFGMVVLGGDASAAPAATQAKPAHKQSAPKPAAVKAPSKKAASKSEAVRAPAAKAAPGKAQADKRADKRSAARAEKAASATGRGGKDRVEKEIVGRKAAAQAAARPERLSKAEARAAAREERLAARAAAREERLAARGKKNRVAREEPPAREPKGRAAVARAEREEPGRGSRRQAAEAVSRIPAPAVPVARPAQLSLPAPMPAPGPVTRGIGREAFVPTTPPVPRGEAVR